MFTHNSLSTFLRWIWWRDDRYDVRLARGSFVLFRTRNQFLPAMWYIPNCSKWSLSSSLGAFQYFKLLSYNTTQLFDSTNLRLKSQYAAKVSKEPYITSKGPDILCTTISITNTTAGKYVNAEIEVSDSARTKHADDGASGNIFPGRQTIASVEIFVNCHPYSGSSCQPTNRKVLANAGTSITVSMRFKAPTTGRKTNVLYIRATDSSNYKGPVTARSFVIWYAFDIFVLCVNDPCSILAK